MATQNKIPVVVLNGFLGSGKTTLFRNLLKQSNDTGLSVGAIVNDMSELDIDGEIIASTPVVEEGNAILRSISSCVLSSDQGIEQLRQAMDDLCAVGNLDVIIIETSGSCHPLPLVRFFQQQEHVRLTAMLVLVDSVMLAHDYAGGARLIPRMQENMQAGIRDTINLLVEQVLFCNQLILTKGDRITELQVRDIAQAIHPINPYVSVMAATFGDVAIDDIINMPEYDYHRVAQIIDELAPLVATEDNDDRPYNMATRVIIDERPFHPQRFWDVCHYYLDQRIYRSKGFFWLAGRDELSLLWNQAAGSINLEIQGHWRAGILASESHDLMPEEVEALQTFLDNQSGRFGDRCCNLTVIGDSCHVDAFVDALNTCFLTEKEIIAWKNGTVFTDPWPRSIVKVST